MTRRVISLWLPRLATDRLRRAGSGQAEAAPSDRPLVLTTEAHGRRLLAAVDAAAAMAGLSPGMPLADAQALVPGLDVRPVEPAAEAALLARLAEWCGRYTPWTAVEGRDGIWLDVAGCAHLFGGEAALLDDLLARIRRFGFAARAALAATPGAAWALARHGAGHADRPVVVPPDGTAAAIAPLPVAALRLAPDAVDTLDRLGLRTVGDLCALPRPSLAARFGEAAVRRLDQALGRVAEPISPQRPAAPFEARLAFAEPIGHPDDIARGLRRLLEDLERRLERAGRGGRRLELTLFRVDGSVRRSAIGTARAVRAPDHLARLFAERLASLDPGFGIETMVLSATATETLAPRQAEAAGLGTGGLGAAGAPPDSLAALLDRLGNRLGFGRISRLRPVDSHLPERAQRLVPAGLPPSLPPPGGRVGVGGDRRTRPLRLLRDPEPAVPLTPEGEDGAPPAVFRWRRRVHQLRRAEGPERIAPEWWQRDRGRAGGTRDYWRVEDAEGRRLWLYREGAREGGEGEGRWLVQGLFA